MDNLKFYEIDSGYIDYLSKYETHLFQNKKSEQFNERKYIGIVMNVNDFNYFIPLSSYKDKHRKLKESLDFIKIKQYAVLNINNMFPVPEGKYTYVDFSKVKDNKYKQLLLREYRVIKSIQDKIRKNAIALYQHKIKMGNDTSLAKRCNDFLRLEKACEKFLE